MRKKIIIPIAILLAVVLGLALVVWLIPIDSYKPLIEQKASAALGRNVAIKGSLSLTLFPMPGVSVEEIEIDNVKGAKDAKFATVKQVKAFVALGPLFSKRVEVSSISVKEPRLFLEQMQDGTNNWTFKVAPSSDAPSAVQVSVKSVDLSSAHFSFRTPKALYATDIDSAFVKLPDLTKAAPEKTPIIFEAQIDKTKLATHFDWNRSANTFAGQANIEFDASLLKKFKADFEVPKLLSDVIEMQSDFTASAESAELKNLIVTMRGQNLKGEATVSFKEGTSLKGTLGGLPGSSSIAFDAQKQAPQGLVGNLSAKIGDLAPLLKWADMPADKVPANLSKNIVAKTQFVIDDTTALRNLDFAIGDAHLLGSLSYEPVGQGHKLVFNLNTPNADQVISLIPRKLDAKIGSASVSGTVSGDNKHLQFSVKPSFGASQISLDGDAYSLDDNMRFDTGVSLSTSQLSSLLKIFGSSAPGNFEKASVNGRIKGNADDLTLDLKTMLEDLALGVKGTVTQMSKAMAFDLDVDASNPSLRSLVARLGSPSKVPDGRFVTSVHLKGNAKNISGTNLKIAVVPNLSATGSFELNNEGSKPSVTAKLMANPLDMEALFPASGAVENNTGAARWSADPIDLSPLNKMNADIDIKALSLKRKDIIVSDPHLAVKIKDGVLSVAPLTGNIFGAGLNASATLTSAGALTLKSDFKNANIRNLVPKGSSIKIVKGLLSANTDLAMQGKSTKDMISSLRGKVNFSSTDGTINGFNLKAISQQIGSYKDWTSVFGLLNTSLGGGQTDFKSFNGEINFAEGVGTIKSMTLNADASVLNAKGLIDLPNYTLNAQAELRLTDHKDFPPIGMRLQGPIDSPSRQIDTSALQGYLVKNVFGNLLDSVMGGKGTPVKSPGDLLNSLFGKKPAAPTPPPK